MKFGIGIESKVSWGSGSLGQSLPPHFMEDCIIFFSTECMNVLQCRHDDNILYINKKGVVVMMMVSFCIRPTQFSKVYIILFCVWTGASSFHNNHHFRWLKVNWPLSIKLAVKSPEYISCLVGSIHQPRVVSLMMRPSLSKCNWHKKGENPKSLQVNKREKNRRGWIFPNRPFTASYFSIFYHPS